MLQKYFLIIVTLIISLSCKREADIYIFSTFREPATDGLYLAWSEDGFQWNDLGGPYLKPEVGTTPVMRDPSAIRASDGTYHMVWTSSWKDDQGFGYASSTDFKSFTDITDKISLPDGHKHGTIFRTDRKTLNNLIRVASEKIVKTGQANN